MSMPMAMDTSLQVREDGPQNGIIASPDCLDMCDHAPLHAKRVHGRPIRAVAGQGIGTRMAGRQAGGWAGEHVGRRISTHMHSCACTMHDTTMHVV